MADPKKTVNIHGKEYVTVAARLEAAHEKHGGQLSINTEILNQSDESVTMKTTVIHHLEDGTVRTFTGHASEVKASNPREVNFGKFLENCETSATGRALAAMGFGIDGAFASADELKSVQLLQNGEVEKLKAEIQALKKDNAALTTASIKAEDARKKAIGDHAKFVERLPAALSSAQAEVVEFGDKVTNDKIDARGVELVGDENAKNIAGWLGRNWKKVNIQPLQSIRHIVFLMLCHLKAEAKGGNLGQAQTETT